MLSCFICSINYPIDPILSMVLTFRVPDPNSLAGVFKILIPISRLWLKFRNKYILQGGAQPHAQTPTWMFGSSPSTCPTWDSLSIVTLPPAQLSRSSHHTNPSTPLKMWNLREGARNVLHTNLVVIWCTFIALWPPTCFSQSCGHLQVQDDLFQKKNTVIIKICLNHSTAVKNHVISG